MARPKKTEETKEKSEVIHKHEKAQANIGISYGVDFKTGRKGIMSINVNREVADTNDIDADIKSLALHVESLWKEFEDEDKTAIVTFVKEELVDNGNVVEKKLDDDLDEIDIEEVDDDLTAVDDDFNDEAVDEDEEEFDLDDFNADGLDDLEFDEEEKNVDNIEDIKKEDDIDVTEIPNYYEMSEEEINKILEEKNIKEVDGKKVSDMDLLEKTMVLSSQLENEE